MPRSNSWLDRYRAGDRDAVWHELRQSGSQVHLPELIDEARAVCDEMARRARQNVEVIIERLNEQGYVFHTNDDQRTRVIPHHAPGASAEEVHEWLKNRFTAVPMTLVSWLRLVGDVWLVGTHPDWPGSSSADPLVIELEGSMYPNHSIIDHYADEVAAHEEDRSAGDRSLFRLPVAPDRLHKENVSGGEPYGFLLPDACADGMFEADVTLPFVSYLRGSSRAEGSPFRPEEPKRSGESDGCSLLTCCHCKAPSTSYGDTWIPNSLLGRPRCRSLPPTPVSPQPEPLVGARL